jgi:hypothetical protein
MRRHLPLLVAFGLLVSGVTSAAQAEEGKEEPGKSGEKKAPPKKKTTTKKKTDKKAEAGHDLEAWGAIKEVKGTPYFTFAYTKVNGKKATKENVFLKAADDALFFQDKMIPYTDLKEGDQIWILARPVEHDVPATQGQTTGGQDRQLQNVVAIVTGEGLKVNGSYADPRDPKLKWCEAQVAKAGPSIQATYEGADYKVVMAKQTPVLQREKAETKPLKNGQMIEVSADKSTERPETKNAADEKKGSFLAKRIVLLDTRLARIVYPAMIE